MLLVTPKMSVCETQGSHDYTIEIAPADTIYLEGQDVQLRYKITTQLPRLEPYRREEVARSLVLAGGPERVEFAFYSSTIPRRDNATEYHGTIYLSALSNCVYSRSTLMPGSFRHLLPGSYEGYSSLDSEHTHFRIEIRPVADSLQNAWEVYKRVKSIEEWAPEYGHLNKHGMGALQIEGKQQLLDSLANLLHVAGNVQRGVPYRGESINAALTILADHRSIWQERDSLTFLNAVDTLLQEPSFDKAKLSISLREAFFNDLSLEQQMEAVQIFMMERKRVAE